MIHDPPTAQGVLLSAGLRPPPVQPPWAGLFRSAAVGEHITGGDVEAHPRQDAGHQREDPEIVEPEDREVYLVMPCLFYVQFHRVFGAQTATSRPGVPGCHPRRSARSTARSGGTDAPRPTSDRHPGTGPSGFRGSVSSLGRHHVESRKAMEDSRSARSFYLPGPGETNVGPVSDRETLSKRNRVQGSAPSTPILIFSPEGRKSMLWSGCLDPLQLR